MPETSICQICGEERQVELLAEGGNACEECRGGLPSCYVCGLPTEDFSEYEGQEVCSSCSDDLPSCEGCNDTILAGQDGGNLGTLCSGCYDNTSYCDRCGSRQHDEDFREVYLDGEQNDSENWCEGCRDAYAFWCDDCSELFSEESAYGGEGMCDSCYTGDGDDDDDEEFNRSGPPYACAIHGHTAKMQAPKESWPGYPRARRFFGVELEVEVKAGFDRRDQLRKVYGQLNPNLFLMKHDGSLANGFEIVGAPGALDKIPEMWDKLLTNRPEGIHAWPCSSSGMHVHVCRESVSALTLGKVLVFVNEPENGPFVSAIAGRGVNTYCTRKKKKLVDGKTWITDDRYQAVNVTGPTVEFRLFKGTLSKLKFYKNLEFCDALIQFCAQTSYGVLGWKNFLNWLDTQPRKVYPNLKQFVSSCDTMENGE